MYRFDQETPEPAVSEIVTEPATVAPLAGRVMVSVLAANVEETLVRQTKRTAKTAERKGHPHDWPPSHVATWQRATELAASCTPARGWSQRVLESVFTTYCRHLARYLSKCQPSKPGSRTGRSAIWQLACRDIANVHRGKQNFFLNCGAKSSPKTHITIWQNLCTMCLVAFLMALRGAS